MTSRFAGLRPSRRQALKAAGLAPALPAPARAGFLSPEELALVDRLSELIIPADAHSPGAREARVAADINRRLTEMRDAIPDHAALRKTWRRGLASIERTAHRLYRVGFLAASPRQQTAILESIAAREDDPRTEDEKFFVVLKATTAESYYTSEIGIHKDLQYKGNTFWDEFPGIDARTVPLVPPGALRRPKP